MSAPLVFFDIAGEDSETLKKFYASVFGWDIADDGRFNVSVSSPFSATIRQDPNEKRLYFGVEDVTRSLEKIVEQGGSIDAPRFEVSGVVVLGLFRDPAGNPLGLVEMDGKTPKIP